MENSLTFGVSKSIKYNKMKSLNKWSIKKVIWISLKVVVFYPFFTEHFMKKTLFILCSKIMQMEAYSSW